MCEPPYSCLGYRKFHRRSLLEETTCPGLVEVIARKIDYELRECSITSLWICENVGSIIAVSSYDVVSMVILKIRPTPAPTLVHRFVAIDLLFAAIVFIAGCSGEPSVRQQPEKPILRNSNAMDGDTTECGSGTTSGASSESGSDTK